MSPPVPTPPTVATTPIKSYASAAATPPTLPLSTTGTNTGRILADRDCSMTDNTKQNTNNNRSKSHRKIQRAGTFNNQKLPRAASASNGLPRGRSYHGSRPLTPAAQAAQDGYFARKAAKLYAERRKAAAAAASSTNTTKNNNQQNDASANAPNTNGTNDSKEVGVINVTVDATGVKINRSPSVRGLGSRQNSRSKMTRSASRQRHTPQRGNEEKENIKTHEADIDAYFSRKRSDVGRKPKDKGTESQVSWDGSMPRRQGSRSFIERSNAATLAAKNTDDKRDEEIQRQVTEETSQVDNVEEKDKLTRSGKKKNKSKVAKHTETSTVGTQQTETDAADSKDGAISPAMSHVSENGTEVDSKVPSPQVTVKHSVEDNKDTESQTSAASATSVQSKAMTETSDTGTSTTTDSCKVPNSGKWCTECAGLGMEITAFLSSITATTSDSSSSSSGSSAKKSWKNTVTRTVLGDSKSKSSSELSRLNEEVALLRSTVAFLYNKVQTKDNIENVQVQNGNHSSEQ